MAKRKANIDQLAVEIEKPAMKPKLNPPPVIPTGDPRHTAKIRQGSQSAEIFCKNPQRREELGLPPLPDPDSYFIQELRS